MGQALATQDDKDHARSRERSEMRYKSTTCKCYQCRRWVKIADTKTWYFDHDNDGWTRGRFCPDCKPEDPNAREKI